MLDRVFEQMFEEPFYCANNKYSQEIGSHQWFFVEGCFPVSAAHNAIRVLFGTLLAFVIKKQ